MESLGYFFTDGPEGFILHLFCKSLCPPPLLLPGTPSALGQSQDYEYEHQLLFCLLCQVKICYLQKLTCWVKPLISQRQDSSGPKLTGQKKHGKLLPGGSRARNEPREAFVLSRSLQGQWQGPGLWWHAGFHVVPARAKQFPGGCDCFNCDVSLQQYFAKGLLPFLCVCQN